MPDKKAVAPAKSDVRAPVIVSPTKAKAGGAGANGSQGKKAKETVKLPNISSSPSSPPGKQPQKDEPKSSLPASPSGASPSRPPSEEILGSAPSIPESATTSRLPDSTNASSHDRTTHREAQDLSLSDSPTTEVETFTPDVQAATLAEAVAAAARAAEEEATRMRMESGNGTVKLVYEQYDELFPIVDGSTTQAEIDEVYCLSFVMPKCLVHLSCHPIAERFERENSGIFDSLVREEPRGTFQGLVKDQTYYVIIEQEEDQLRRDQEATRATWAPAIQGEKLKKDDGRGFESCSCIYGNPCVDEYGCKD